MLRVALLWSNDRGGTLGRDLIRAAFPGTKKPRRKSGAAWKNGSGRSAYFLVTIGASFVVS